MNPGDAIQCMQCGRSFRRHKLIFGIIAGVSVCILSPFVLMYFSCMNMGAAIQETSKEMAAESKANIDHITGRDIKKPSSAPISIDPANIVEGVRANEVSGSDYLRGKLLLISGVIEDISDSEDSYYVDITSATAKQDARVMVRFPHASQRSFLSAVKIGDAVTVEATFMEIAGYRAPKNVIFVGFSLAPTQ